MTDIRQRTSSNGNESSSTTATALPSEATPLTSSSSSTPAAPVASSLTTWLVPTLVSGVFFGMGLERSGVFQPDVIRDQLLFKRWLMMKIFLSAVASGQVALTIVRRVFPDRWNAAKTYTSCSTLSTTTPLLGGLLLGAGMSVSGACPGMVLVQFSAGSATAIFTILGGLLGALTYVLLQPRIPMDGHTLFKDGNKPTMRTADADIGVSFTALSAALFVGMVAFIATLEIIFPWTTELHGLSASQAAAIATAQATGTLTAWWNAPYWSPIVSGTIIGLGQVPLVIGTGRTLGSSSCYVTLAANLLPESSLSGLTLANMVKSNWWQPVLLLSAMITGFINANAGHIFGDVRTLPIHHCLIGGFLIIFGARLGGGCPSGHGLSGMPFLSTRAFAAVAGMFIGTIISPSTVV